MLSDKKTGKQFAHIDGPKQSFGFMINVGDTSIPATLFANGYCFDLEASFNRESVDRLKSLFNTQRVSLRQAVPPGGAWVFNTHHPHSAPTIDRGEVQRRVIFVDIVRKGNKKFEGGPPIFDGDIDDFASREFEKAVLRRINMEVQSIDVDKAKAVQGKGEGEYEGEGKGNNEGEDEVGDKGREKEEANLEREESGHSQGDLAWFGGDKSTPAKENETFSLSSPSKNVNLVTKLQEAQKIFKSKSTFNSPPKSNNDGMYYLTPTGRHRNDPGVYESKDIEGDFDTVTSFHRPFGGSLCEVEIAGESLSGKLLKYHEALFQISEEQSIKVSIDYLSTEADDGRVKLVYPGTEVYESLQQLANRITSVLPVSYPPNFDMDHEFEFILDRPGTVLLTRVKIKLTLGYRCSSFSTCPAICWDKYFYLLRGEHRIIRHTGTSVQQRNRLYN